MNYFYDDDDEDEDDPVQDETENEEEDNDGDEDEENGQRDGGSNSSTSSNGNDETEDGNDEDKNDDDQNDDDQNDDGQNDDGKKDDGSQSDDNQSKKKQEGNSGQDNGSKKSGDKNGGNTAGGNSGNTPKPNGGNEVAKKAGEEAGKKAAAQTAANAGGSAATGAAGTAGAAGASGAAAGASGAAAGASGAAAGAGAGAALGVVLFWVVVVIVIIIILVGVIMFFLTVPGMLTEKLGEFFANLGTRFANFFLGKDTTKNIKNSEVYEILDYLEEMGYDLKGYGFLNKDADPNDAGDSEYDNKQGVIRTGNGTIGKEKDPENSPGKIDEDVDAAYSGIILKYIMSDNYVFTVKNFNETGTGSAVANWLGPLGDLGAALFVGDTVEAWGKGLLSLYIEDEDGDEKPYKPSKLRELFGWNIDWNYIDVDAEKKILKIRRGWGANYVQYSLDGWTGRYGMPLELLLSIHIATMKPDLAYEMVDAFATDVRIVMRDVSGSDSAMKAGYKKDFNRNGDDSDYLTYNKLKSMKGSGIDGWFLSKEEAQKMLRAGIDSPLNCTYTEETRYIVSYSNNKGLNGNANENFDWATKEISDENWGDGDKYFFIIDDDDIENKDFHDFHETSFSDIRADIGKESNLYKYYPEEQHKWFTLGKSIIKLYNEDDYGQSGYNYHYGQHNRIRDIAESRGYPHKDSSLTKEKQMIQNDEYDTDTSGGTYAIRGEDKSIKPRQDDDSKKVITTTRGDVSIEEEPYYMVCEEYEREWDGSYDGKEGTFTWMTYIWTIRVAPSVYEPALDVYYLDVIWFDPATEEEKASSVKCSQDGSLKKCCSNCKRYIKKVLKELKNVNDNSFSTYIPYIKWVRDHWFRDVYFELDAGGTDPHDEKSTKIKLTTIDADYEMMTNERWTEYETDAKGNDILYWYDESKSDGIGERYTGNLEEAQEKGHKVVKKQKAVYAEDLDGTIIDVKNDGSWSAYETQDTSGSAEWTPAYDNAEEGELLSRIYYKRIVKKDVVQTQDGLRGTTNKTIKDMFLNRYYFTYDGTKETAEIIKYLRKKVLGDEAAYGQIEKDLETPYRNFKIKDSDGNDKTIEEVKLGDYVSTVSISHDSLAAFSILENTHTMDADFIYKDFKELMVELGFFTKEELSDYTPKVLQFLIPNIPTYGYPNYLIDKNENEYGTFIHSQLDYKAAEKQSMAALMGVADSTRNQQSTLDDGTGTATTEQQAITSQSTAQLPNTNYNSSTNSGSLGKRRPYRNSYNQ